MTAEKHNPQMFYLAEVNVDGEVWLAVATLENSGPDDRHYLVRRDAAGRSDVTFGDGVRGRRPADGSSITATYRSGGGHVVVTMQRSAEPSTADQPLWTVIRTSSSDFEFGDYEQDPFLPPGPARKEPMNTRWCRFVLALLAVMLLAIVALAWYVRNS